MASHAYPYLEGNHAGQFVHELAATLVRLGHQVHAVIPAPSRKCENRMDGVDLEFYQAWDRVSYGHADTSYVKGPRVAVALSLGSAIHKLRQAVRQYDIDIIHAHWAVPSGFVGSVVRLLTGTPLVITTHGRDVYSDPEIGALVPTLWYVRPFLRFALRQADRIVAVSQDCRRRAVEAGAPAERVVVLHNGVDTRRFSPRELDPSGVRRALGVAPQARLILFVGTLAYRKGVDLLIRAMPEILKWEPMATALIVGDGPERDVYVGLRDSLGLERVVIFCGWIPNTDLVEYENTADVLVVPSRRESFGIAAIEAMACGKPVVGTRVGGLGEVIDHEETGLLVEPDDPEGLAVAILRILKDDILAERLGTQARCKVEAEYDWARVARRTVGIYERLVGLG